MGVNRRMVGAIGVLSLVLIGTGIAFQSITEFFWVGTYLLIVGVYLYTHVLFGPLDWYLAYKLYNKLRR